MWLLLDWVTLIAPKDDHISAKRGPGTRPRFLLAGKITSTKEKFNSVSI